jgi:hypothetical protein
LLFFPLLAYSTICYLLLLFRQVRFAQSFIVRAGVYTGTLLALQYSIVILIYALGSFAYVILLTWIFPFVCSFLYRRAVARWTAPRVNKVLLILGLGVILISALVTRAGVPFFILVGLTMAAPFWCFLLAVRASIWLIKTCETRITSPRGLGLAAWASAYLVAWRYDLLKMYELYAALPPEPPPDCYIATAAARGHPEFVHSWIIRRNGKPIYVNVQLQRLKCAELAMMAVNPRLHKLLRKMYDVNGKFLALRIQNPLMADVAYLLLKPWEWLARLILRFVLPEIDSISGAMYTK